jgi:hypothetical protein
MKEKTKETQSYKSYHSKQDKCMHLNILLHYILVNILFIDNFVISRIVVWALALCYGRCWFFTGNCATFFTTFVFLIIDTNVPMPND